MKVEIICENEEDKRLVLSLLKKNEPTQAKKREFYRGRWTKEEDEIILKNKELMPIALQAQFLARRTPAAISTRKHYLKTKEGKNIAQIWHEEGNPDIKLRA